MAAPSEPPSRRTNNVTPTLRSDTSLFDALWRTLLIVAVLLSTWIAATPALSASQLLDVDAGEEVDTLKVWVRDGGDTVPVISIDKQQLDLELSSSGETNRFKPLTLLVDTSNITEERLFEIKKKVDDLKKKEKELADMKVQKLEYFTLQKEKRETAVMNVINTT